ncbi:MAG: O-antigen ligase family protein [Clostridia bacterium]|nr:O-antigen ligase family protein [Clostridia bacterium]
MKDAKRGSNVSEGVKSCMAYAGMIYVAVIALVHPLVYHDYYFDINRCKFYVFIALTILGALAVCAGFIADRRANIRLRFDMDLRSASMAAFAALSVISCLISPYSRAALVGQDGRFCGLVFVLALCIMSFITAASIQNQRDGQLKLARVLTISLIVSGSLCALLGVINRMGVDLLGFYDLLDQQLSNAFISTIGNRNFFSAFLCLIVPLSAGVYISSDDSRFTVKGVFSAASFFISVMAMFFARIDSGFVGLSVCAVALIPTAFRNKDNFRKCLALSAMFFAAGYTTRVAMLLCYVEPLRGAGSIAQFLLKGNALAIAFIISTFALCAWIGLIEKRVTDDSRILANARKTICIILALAAVSVAAFTVYMTLNPQITLSGIGRYFRINNAWGSGRMRIWRRSFEIFAEAPMAQKLFGFGSDTVVYAFDDAIASGVIAPMKKTIDASHNEYINYLLTNGILGLSAYCAFVISGVKCLLRSQCAYVRPLGLAALSYAAQAFFNIAQPITTPLFALILSIALKGGSSQRFK